LLIFVCMILALFDMGPRFPAGGILFAILALFVALFAYLVLTSLHPYLAWIAHSLKSHRKSRD
ncbi:MAG TPA: hypothetical protein VG711_08010, partial [Phycisphaerales bacterium]|nr:hypothetical protein [Phycisphaerales bacterium]